jgi:hypothetical protein
MLICSIESYGGESLGMASRIPRLALSWQAKRHRKRIAIDSGYAPPEYWWQSPRLPVRFVRSEREETHHP